MLLHLFKQSCLSGCHQDILFKARQVHWHHAKFPMELCYRIQISTSFGQHVYMKQTQAILLECESSSNETIKWRLMVGCVHIKPAFFLPGSPSLWDISSKVSTSSSCGAWITITVDPSILNKHPIFPCKLSFSFKKKDDRMALRNKKGTNKHGISNIHLLIKLHVV